MASESSGRIRLGEEDRTWLGSLPSIPSVFRGAFARPREITLDDIKKENQGQIGSCQGNALTSCLERLNNVRGGPPVELSRIFAYLASQKLSNLLGRDQGSTITAGIRVALEQGVPPESKVPYPSGYPDRSSQMRILSPANVEAGSPYRALSSWAVPHDVDAVMDFVAGGGAINIGIRWWGGILPQDRIVRTFRPPSRSGGHAIAILGYTQNGDLRFMNSHNDGEFLVSPAAFLAMLRDSYTAAVGLAGEVEPKPVDWVRNSPLYDWNGYYA